VENKFLVTIAPDAPVGVHEARVLSRLGISSARAFSVSNVDEVTRTAANNSVETALKLPLNTICNATMTKRAVDFYAFEGKKGQRVAVDCAATGIDSRLTPVVIIANDKGADLLVNRTGGVIDFTPPADGTYLIKVNDLTYQGGERHFYRLALREVKGNGPAPQQPTTPASAPSPGRRRDSPRMPRPTKSSQHDKAKDAKKVTLPLDVAGSFFPAADVDSYEFEAKKGEVWWVEVASERIGRPTDPFVLVQHVAKNGEVETLTDVAELYDIVSPGEGLDERLLLRRPALRRRFAGRPRQGRDQAGRTPPAFPARPLRRHPQRPAECLPAPRAQGAARFRHRRLGRAHDPAQRRPRRLLQADLAARRRRHGLRSGSRCAATASTARSS
jgi:hypothetical protein